MEHNRHQTLLHTAPFGYAYHKVITNISGEPVDFEYLEANAAFEELTGLKVSEILGKKITTPKPGSHLKTP